MTKENNVFIFPKVYKFSENFDENGDDQHRIEMIEKLTSHYAHQLAAYLEHHGVDLNQRFIKDLSVTMTFMSAAIARNAGIYHPLQQVLDQMGTEMQQGKVSE